MNMQRQMSFKSDQVHECLMRGNMKARKDQRSWLYRLSAAPLTKCSEEQGRGLKPPGLAGRYSETRTKGRNHHRREAKS